MRNLGPTLTERQVEEVLTGQNTDVELSALTDTVGALQKLRDVTPKKPSADLIVQAASIAREGSVRQVPRPLPRRSKVWRLAPVAAAATLAFATVAPLSALADTAAPNDLLYSVDLFFEHFGIGAGGLAERLDEVDTMTERGDLEEARQHLQSSVDTASTEELTVHAEDIQAAEEELETRPSDKNPNKGPGNNSGNDNPGTNPGEDNPNAGPGNNSGNQGNPGPDNPNAGPGNNSGNTGNQGNTEDNPNAGPGNNSGNTGNQGNTEDNPNAGPGNNSGNTGNQENTEDNPNAGPGKNSGNPGNPGGPGKGSDKNSGSQ